MNDLKEANVAAHQSGKGGKVQPPYFISKHGDFCSLF